MGISNTFAQFASIWFIISTWSLCNGCGTQDAAEVSARHRTNCQSPLPQTGAGLVDLGAELGDS